MLKLRPYQQQGIDSIASNYAKGIRRQIYQLPTGGGKTVTFAGMCFRFIKKFDKSIVIAVHREELLQQARKTLYNNFHIHSEPITAGRKHIPHCRVYVAMVETLNNLLKKRPKFADHVGMLIIDEVHLANFNKIYDYFQTQLIVGFSATPLAASKKDPLKNHYDTIVTGPQIVELIDMGSLVQNESHRIKGINPKQFGVKRGEYDMQAMSGEFSTVRNIKNTVIAYEKYCKGEKTMVFNVNIEHSILVTNAFLEAGYNAKHLDGNETKEKRKEIFTWFKNTPDAIICNVAVATTGFDEPSVRNIIVNRSTMSLPLWLQMTGRGSRPDIGKDYFRIIDLGGNVMAHGDWSQDRDWEHIFYNPGKPSDGTGVAPIKECDNCEAIIPASATVCKFCGHIHERRIGYDVIAPDFEKVVSVMSVEAYVNEANEAGHKEWSVFFRILERFMTTLKYRSGDAELTIEDVDRLYATFEPKVKEWRKLIGKPYDKYCSGFALQKFTEEYKKLVEKKMAFTP